MPLLIVDLILNISRQGTYVTHKKIRGAMGIKIAAPGLDGAVAGGSMLVPKEGDDLEELQEEVMEDLQNILDNDNKADSGVSGIRGLRALGSWPGHGQSYLDVMIACPYGAPPLP